MRVLIALVFAAGLLLSTLPAPAAEPAATVKLRDYRNQRNVVVETQEIELGTVTDKNNTEITFYAVVCSSPSAKPAVVKGMEIVVSKSKEEAAKEEASPISVTSYLDYDELNVFKEGIGTLVTTADDWKDDKSIRNVSLRSRDDFTMQISKYPLVGASFATVSGYDGENFVFASFDTPQQLLSIKGYIEKALKVLEPANTKS